MQNGRWPSRAIPPLALAALLFSGDGADSYLLVSNSDDWSAQFAQRWNPAVWGPGETLEWVIAAEPGWTSPWVEPAERRGGPALFETPEEALPLIAWGLAVWSNIESADIRWEVTGVENVEGDVRDGRNTVVARITPEGILGQGRPWWRRVNGEWTVEECDVLMSPLVVADALAGDPYHLGSLVHEFGHCLNLQHSAAIGDAAEGFDDFPWSRGHPRPVGGVFPDSRGHPPVMALAWRSFPEPTLDDAIGASLMRPAPGWLSTTGAISGRITVEGRNAVHVMVFAARMTSDGVEESVSAMTEADGDFHIEGLVPGVYVVRAGSMNRPDAHGHWVPRGAILDARDKILLDPVTVRAGQETGGIRLDLPRGRQGRDWLPNVSR